MRAFCLKCGHTQSGAGSATGICPRCGATMREVMGNPSFFRSKPFLIIGGLFGALAILLVVLYFTNQGVAAELRQIRQPKPNLFYVGIDVSATIDPATLTDFKYNVISRLKNFIGDPAVSYHIVSFGHPGCGMESVRRVVSTQSPADEVTFTYEVENKVRDVTVPQINATSTKPLTTPLHALLENVLPERVGGRIIIFSDLLNEDSDCPRQHPFPTEAVRTFGRDTNGQIIFLYTPVHPSKLEKQRAFIDRMNTLAQEGEVRAFFYPIPERSDKRSSFMTSQLQNAIPATTFEVVWERATRVVDTIVTAVRG